LGRDLRLREVATASGQVLRTLHVKSRATTAETRIGSAAAAVTRAATVGKLVAALKTDRRPVVMVWWRGLLATVIAAVFGQFAHRKTSEKPLALDMGRKAAATTVA